MAVAGEPSRLISSRITVGGGAMAAGRSDTPLSTMVPAPRAQQHGHLGLLLADVDVDRPGRGRDHRRGEDGGHRVQDQVLAAHLQRDHLLTGRQDPPDQAGVVQDLEEVGGVVDAVEPGQLVAVDARLEADGGGGDAGQLAGVEQLDHAAAASGAAFSTTSSAFSSASSTTSRKSPITITTRPIQMNMARWARFSTSFSQQPTSSRLQPGEPLLELELGRAAAAAPPSSPVRGSLSCAPSGGRMKPSTSRMSETLWLMTLIPL